MKAATKNIKIELNIKEKASLRKHRVRIKDLPDYNLIDLQEKLEISYERARDIYALMQFQLIPTVGIKFAEDLISIGLYSLEELKGKNGAELFEKLELKRGYWIDSCVEDQFRLAVNFAETGNPSKKWWDFTLERKAFREKNGYPVTRPTKAWYD